MEFSLSKTHKMLRWSVRKFAEEKIAPRVLEIDKEEFPYDVIRDIGQMGYIGLINSKSSGGNDMGHLARMIVIEELSRVFPSLGFYLQAGNLFMYAVEKFGSEEQKKKYLPDLCAGNKVSSFAVTEASGGSDPMSITTAAQSNMDGYIINGRKTYITNADVSSVMGFLCRTGEKDFSVFCVEKDTDGFEVTRREPRPGFRCIPVNELSFTNCRLGNDYLVGKEGSGLSTAITVISTAGRTGAAGVGLGALEGAFEGALKFCKERVMYSKPIYDLQAIQFALTEMNTEIEAARWLCYLPACLLDQGKSPRDIIAEISRAKLYVVDVGLKNCVKAQQLMGAYGQSPEYRVEMYLRDMLELLTAGGTQEIMKVNLGRIIGN